MSNNGLVIGGGIGVQTNPNNKPLKSFNVREVKNGFIVSFNSNDGWGNSDDNTKVAKSKEEVLVILEDYLNGR